MINYVLKKVSSQTHRNQTYKERFEFALVNLEKVQQDRKVQDIRRKVTS